MLLNFLKMELYRLLKMKSTYVMAIIIFLVTFVYNFVILGLDIEALMNQALGGGVSTGYDTEMDVEYYGDDEYGVFTGDYDVNTAEPVAQRSIVGVGMFHYNTIADTYQMNLQGLIPLLLLAILFGLFYGNDYSTHVNKNYTIINGRRWVGFTAKTLACMIYCFAFHLLIWLICALSHVFWADSINPGFSLKSVIYVLLTYLVTITIMVMIGFIATLFKSKAAGITYGVLVSIGTLSLPIRIADFIISAKYGWQDFSLNYFIPSRMLATLAVDTNGKMVLISVICAIIYVVSAFFGSLAFLKKRDLTT